MKTIFKIMTIAAAAVSFTGCYDDFDLNYQAPVKITFSGVNEDNIVTVGKGVTSYTADISVSSMTGIGAVVIFGLNATTGEMGGQLDLVDLENTPQSYSMSYSIGDLTENRGIKVSVTDGAGNSFERNLVVKITPAVDFSKSSIHIETAEVFYGVYYAPWYEGRVYMSNDPDIPDATEYKTSVDFAGAEIKLSGSDATTGVFISPDKRSEHGLTGVAGMTSTKFGLTTLTAADYNAVTRISDTPIRAAESLATEDYAAIESGKVYVYKSANGRSGLILVSSVTNKTATVESADGQWVPDTAYRDVVISTKTTSGN